MHGIKVGIRENERHVLLLLQAHAVLAGQRPTDIDTGPQNLAAGFHDAGHGIGLPLVEEDARVQVAIARVENVGDGEARIATDLPYPAQHLQEPGAWNHPVHQIVVGCQDAQRAQGTLAPGPQSLPLHRLRCRSYLAGTLLSTQRLHFGGPLLHLSSQAIHLDEEDGAPHPPDSRIAWPSPRP